MGWIRKHDIDDEHLTLPSEIVSNEEFDTPEQAEEQTRVEQRLDDYAK